MKKKLTIFLLLLSFLGVFFLFDTTQSVDLKNQVVEQIKEGADTAGLGNPTSPQIIIVEVLKIALGVVGSIFLALVVYGGFVYVNSRGDEEQVKKAQKIIVGSIIGLTIILLSYSVTLFVGTQATGQKVNIQ
ncbi:MAG: hypothetical protein HOA57_01290 [Candidatus Magasanikbacteria bacterium]|jgi:hypothetical protein|nr:hypothetical protein [Candidatus Magasanikbacteria bacterium]MBT4315055.1 hypothetical protein [Candidatus Magasanikbacteria bacterium]MBT4546834.1 hypothetical protein [Candidatus Magasanikbacteria bacterium]MBT6818999.1 hypothetical protein [Candidatus Magasanikbacteria bacterium]